MLEGDRYGSLEKTAEAVQSLGGEDGQRMKTLVDLVRVAM